MQSLNLAGAGRWQRGENLIECRGFSPGAGGGGAGGVGEVPGDLLAVF